MTNRQLLISISHRVLLVGLFVPLGERLVSVAQAQDVTCVEVLLPMTRTNWTETFQVPQFDSNLGILQAVEVTSRTTANGLAMCESLSAEPFVASVLFAATVEVDLGLDPLVFSNAMESVTTPLSAFDGSIDFAGSSGSTMMVLEMIDDGQGFVPFSLVPQFEGLGGFVDLTVTANSSSNLATPGNAVGMLQLDAAVGVEVCYFYSLDCNQNGIADDREILGGAPDCDLNQVPDECDVLEVGADVNLNGLPDRCEPNGISFCNGDNVPGASCGACPCGNDAPPGTPGGCMNSMGQSAQLIASGMPSITADTLSFDLMGAPPNTPAFLASGDNAPPIIDPCPSGSGTVGMRPLDGLRCVGGNLVRHGLRATDSAGNVGIGTPGWGGNDNPPGGLVAQGAFTAGQTRRFQCFYRDDMAQVCMRGQNTTNGVSFMIMP